MNKTQTGECRVASGAWACACVAAPEADLLIGKGKAIACTIIPGFPLKPGGDLTQHRLQSTPFKLAAL
jgi:hypothetical protein